MNDNAAIGLENSDYRVLARRWRPRDFNAIAGQEPVVDALVNGLNSGRVHHAFLFTGTRGVGKTTLARILAKCLNCEQGVSASPCGQCNACQDIDEGRFIDLLEVDAASRTKVEDTRELLDNVQYAPTRGRYKVYLIDEVHMLSTSSFNALLKTLEEPPAHVKFILATTDPQKIPVTILSRCLRFNLRRLEPDRIFGYLSEKLTAESVGFDDGALQAISRAADGSMRDSLSLLDQALAHGSGELRQAAVASMLGMVEDRLIEQVVEGLQAGSMEQLLATVAEIYSRGQSADRSLQQLALTLHQIAVIQQYPDFHGDTESSPEWLEAMSGQLPAEAVQLYYQIAVTGRKELSLAPDPRVGLEMTLLRMLAFQPADDIPEMIPSRATSTAAPATGPAPGSAAEPVHSTKVSVEASAAAVVKPSTPVEPAQVQEPAAQITAPAAPSVNAPVNDGVAETTDSDNADKLVFSPEKWGEHVDKLRVKGAVRLFTQHLLLTEVTSAQDMFIFKMHEGDAHMHTQSIEQKLRSAIALHTGHPVRTKVQYTQTEVDSPAKQFQANQDAAHEQARQTIETDPVVNAMLDTFDATIAPGSIKPVSHETNQSMSDSK